MQRALMDFTELANSEISYSASLSGVGGRNGEWGGSNKGQRKKDKMQNTTETTLQALDRHCESHSRHEMSKVTESWQVSNV